MNKIAVSLILTLIVFTLSSCSSNHNCNETQYFTERIMYSFREDIESTVIDEISNYDHVESVSRIYSVEKLIIAVSGSNEKDNVNARGVIYVHNPELTSIFADDLILGRLPENKNEYVITEERVRNLGLTNEELLNQEDVSISLFAEHLGEDEFDEIELEMKIVGIIGSKSNEAFTVQNSAVKITTSDNNYYGPSLLITLAETINYFEEELKTTLRANSILIVKNDFSIDSYLDIIKKIANDYPDQVFDDYNNNDDIYNQIEYLAEYFYGEYCN